MSRFSKRALIWSVAACFAVLFGIDLATSGVEDVHGPLAGQSAVQQQAPGASHPAVERTQATDPGVVFNPPHPQPRETSEPEITVRSPLPHVPAEESFVNRVADTAGNVLHGTAQKGVELLVSLFESILD